MSTAIDDAKRARPKKHSSQAQAKFAATREVYASVLRRVLPNELQAHGTTLLEGDVNEMADSLAAALASIGTNLAAKQGGETSKKSISSANSEWISTQEAADRCGFSRPFVAALLDSGTYQGKVHRTPGGHRKVLASEFEALVAEASAQAPKTLAQARKAVDLTPQHTTEVVPSTERKRSRARAQALAKKLGIAA